MHRAKALVMDLVEELGFDAVDAGSLDESWRQQPGTPVYAADLDRDGVAAALARDASAERPMRVPGRVSARRHGRRRHRRRIAFLDVEEGSWVRVSASSGIERLHSAAESQVGPARRARAWSALVARGEHVHVRGDRAAGDRRRAGAARSSLFRIASTSKPITAAATLALAEEGLFALDEPVDRLIPELADRRVLRADGRAACRRPSPPSGR